MSMLLAKLRQHFDDPLLVREGRTLALTPLAESLVQPVQSVLVAARDVLTVGQSFDPAGESRTFSILASDYAATVLLRPVFPRLLAEAPGVRLQVEPLRADLVETLRARRCDLLLWPLQLPEQELLRFPHTTLFEDEFVAVVDAANPLPGPLTAQDLARLPAVRVAPVGERLDVPRGKLAERGLSQPVAITVGSFTQALQMVAGTELVTLTQRRLFQALGPAFGLREVPLAMDPVPLTTGAFWHPRHAQDPAHKWLRGHLARAAGELARADPA
ncbi:DNA-binding transcriptional LysR family regulator [Crossiella equi]|uniref:DNA-binding transcriptional LysR family regulator n=2 Tax=Crossiella equi TaxID=130796 RepID=A0ABS5AR03_9PSEU|nr:DNA-binding transcriptional LysR family regulator [Crossiella equi]